MPTRRPPRTVALSGQLSCAHPPAPLRVVWRDAADRLPRRVLISGRDNDPIVIGSWPPAREIAGVRSWLHASRSALSQLSLFLFGNEIQADRR